MKWLASILAELFKALLSWGAHEARPRAEGADSDAQTRRRLIARIRQTWGGDR